MKAGGLKQAYRFSRAGFEAKYVTTATKAAESAKI